MSKRVTVTIYLFFVLFTSLTLSAVGLGAYDTNAGNFWSPPELAAPIVLIDMEPGNDGTIHLIGYITVGPETHELQYTRRDIVGNWSSPETIDDDMVSTRPLSGDVAIASDGTVHVIYLDNPGGGNHYLEYAKRNPNGTWTSGVQIADPTHDAFQVSLFLNNANQPYASWASYGQPGLYARYQVSGSWSDIKRVDVNHFPGIMSVLMDAQQNIHYFWFNYDIGTPSNVRVNYRKQLANNTFETIIPISDPPTGPYAFPRGIFTGLDGQNLVVTWGLDNGTSQDIFFADFTNGSWNSEVQLNTTNGDYSPVFIGASGNNVYIINGDNDTDTYTYRFRPFGGSWTSEPLNFVSANALMLAHVAPDNTFHLLWDDQANPIQYRTRRNFNTWSAIEPINSDFGFGRRIIKQQGQDFDLAWIDSNFNSMYSHGMTPITNLPPEAYLPIVNKQ